MIFDSFERKYEKLAPSSLFFRRVLKFFGIACGMIGVVLLIGVAGYHWCAGFSWINSILEASMILGGMGPVNGDDLKTEGAKLFASAYALFSGLIFISSIGIGLSPIMHRLLHTFHLDKELSKGPKGK